jgi:phytanoyl-CoA hydroxylase
MSAGQFSPSELQAFHDQGFVVARALADLQTCEAMKALALEQLARRTPPIEYEADLQYPGAPRSRDSEGGATVRRLLQACSRAPLFRQWATSARLAQRLGQLVGATPVLVQAHHNCVMTKHPRFGSLTGWHQDIRYWSFERPELVSLWLALGRERDENGGLWFIPGSHQLVLEQNRFDEALFLRADRDDNRALIATRVQPELDTGDAIFFHSRLLHSAGRNRENEPKLSVVFTYRAGDNRPLPGSRSASSPELPMQTANGSRGLGG